MTSEKPSNDPIARFRPSAIPAEPSSDQIPPLYQVETSTWGLSPVPEPNWKIRNVLAAGETGCLAGRSNCGKGLLSIQLAVAIALGQGQFGREGSGRHGTGNKNYKL